MDILGRFRVITGYTLNQDAFKVLNFEFYRGTIKTIISIEQNDYNNYSKNIKT